jgi:hypothetical protein
VLPLDVANFDLDNHRISTAKALTPTNKIFGKAFAQCVHRQSESA